MIDDGVGSINNSTIASDDVTTLPHQDFVSLDGSEQPHLEVENTPEPGLEVEPSSSSYAM
jgi:hypothetical protein